MRLYYHPASTTSRMIMLFASEEGIDFDYKVVDLFTGEHLKPDFAAINPNCLVPVLEDADFRLTESSAILKYLAGTLNIRETKSGRKTETLHTFCDLGGEKSLKGNYEKCCD